MDVPFCIIMRKTSDGSYCPDVEGLEETEKRIRPVSHLTDRIEKLEAMLAELQKKTE